MEESRNGLLYEFSRASKYSLDLLKDGCNRHKLN